MALPDQNLKPTKNQVPGQFLGYGLQYTRMLMLLLESPAEAVVSLEVFDDVGVQGGDSVIASQLKSSTSRNPVSNRAEAFWKTLFNWLNAIEAGQLVVTDTLFELYVFGNFEGEICTLFSEATSEADAKLALSEAENLLRAEGEEPPPSMLDRC